MSEGKKLVNGRIIPAAALGTLDADKDGKRGCVLLELGDDMICHSLSGRWGLGMSGHDRGERWRDDVG